MWRSALAASILLPLALLSLAAGSATAHEDGHGSAVCLLAPSIVDGRNAWTPLDDYHEHGGTETFVLRRESATAASGAERVHVYPHPDTGPAPVPIDAVSTWRLSVAYTAAWIPDVAPSPDPSELVLVVEARLRLGEALLALDAEELSLEDGLFNDDGSVNVYGVVPDFASGPQSFRSDFEFRPQQLPPRRAGTLDEVSAEFAFYLKAPKILGATGSASLRVHLTEHGPANGPGTVLEIPTDCTGAFVRSFAIQTSNASCVPASEACQAEGDEICQVVEGYCEALAGSKAPPPEAESVPADHVPTPASWTPPLPLWGAGLAGFLALLGPVRRFVGAKAGGALGAFLLLPLFSRIETDAALANPRRQLILGYVERSPGVRFHELKRELDIPHGVLVHHLRVLRAQNLLVWERRGRRLHFRLPGQPLAEALDPDAMALLEFVGRHPGLTIQETAEALGWTRRKTAWWTDRLVRAGRLERRPEGNRRRLLVVTLDQARVAPPPIATA